MTSVTGLAVLFALLSATAAACSTSLQHHAAEGAPDTVTGSWGLLGHLVRRPVWLIGQVLGVVTLAFHALALNAGPITLVQPLVISGIVLAVPLRSAIARRLPEAREMRGVLLAAAGLAGFLVVSAPSSGRSAEAGIKPLLIVGATLVVSAAVLASATRVSDPTRRAFLLGAAAGGFFALVAVTLKMSLAEVTAHGLPGLAGTWPVYALAVAGVGGVLGNQLAYRSARLSSSMPVLNAVDCLVAIGFGFVLFHEVPRHSLTEIGLEGLGLVALVAGLWILARIEARPLEAAGPNAQGLVGPRSL
jgi:hypothetical protein